MTSGISTCKARSGAQPSASQRCFTNQVMDTGCICSDGFPDQMGRFSCKNSAREACDFGAGPQWVSIRIIRLVHKVVAIHGAGPTSLQIWFKLPSSLEPTRASAAPSVPLSLRNDHRKQESIREEGGAWASIVGECKGCMVFVLINQSTLYI